MELKCRTGSPGYVSLEGPVQKERRFGALFRVLLGFLVQTVPQSIIVLALIKYLHDSAVLYELIEGTVDGLYSSQPSNPLAQFLLWNKKSLLCSSRSFFSRVILVSMITTMIVVGALILLISYEVASAFERRKNTVEKQLKQKRRKELAEKGAQFALGFTAGTALVTILLLIPFFLLPNKKPESTLTFVLRFYDIRDNPLAEILKGIVKETFKKNVLFEKYTAKVESCILGVFSASMALFCVVLVFLVISALCETRTRSTNKESPSETPENSTSTSLESLCTPVVSLSI
ncbi:hypothetical protein [Neorickettsia sennetsu]|uniref:Uncharacterized protein n=1 Tax=Ehrlichia sennetsu (strain ATCC VR-367 / Miyayama) TaxID=222891 RepID=Q2GCR0_EHRS3|nr:hypothetical protein [Neorickettsia sennetsu]ABD45808.1 hypothetical protein NSE_0869 [Neorickettsia sennetsu str. Miyayama]